MVIIIIKINNNDSNNSNNGKEKKLWVNSCNSNSGFNALPHTHIHFLAQCSTKKAWLTPQTQLTPTYETPLPSPSVLSRLPLTIPLVYPFVVALGEGVHYAQHKVHDHQQYQLLKDPGQDVCLILSWCSSARFSMELFPLFLQEGLKKAALVCCPPEGGTPTAPPPGPARTRWRQWWQTSSGCAS